MTEPTKKQSANGWIRYLSENRPILIKKHPELAQRQKEIPGLLREKWGALDDEEKNAYKQRHQEEIDQSWDRAMMGAISKGEGGSAVKSSGSAKKPSRKAKEKDDPQILRKFHAPSDTDNSASEDEDDARPSAASSKAESDGRRMNKGKASLSKESASAKKSNLASASKSKSSGGDATSSSGSRSGTSTKKSKESSEESKDETRKDFEVAMKYLLERFDEYCVSDCGPKMNTVTFTRRVPK